MVPRLPAETRLHTRVNPQDPTERLRQMETIRNRVASRIKVAQVRQKRCYDHHWNPTREFAPGDLVLVRRKAVKRGIPPKLQPCYIGLFEVSRRLTETTYEVQDLAWNRTPTRLTVFPALSPHWEEISWEFK